MFRKIGSSIKIVRIAAVIASLLTGSYLGPICADEPPAAGEKAPKKILLERYLATLGVRLDCYFTLEQDRRDSKSRTFLSVSRVNDESAAIMTVDDLIAQLREEIPNATIVRNAGNPQIIHLSEPSLQQLDKYPLNQKISLDFSGTLEQLLDIISQQTASAVTWNIGILGVPWAIRNDVATSLSVRARGTSVRDVFTHYLPLSNYSRILWSAEAVVYQDKPQTWMHFYGPADEFSARLAAPHLRHVRFVPAQDFTLGEVAYRLSPDNEEAAGKALDYIKAQFAKDNAEPPHQVRWAMLFLGKHKVEAAIPVLLKHLDYQYAPSPLLDERFPAFAALKMMGEPANDAVLKALATETDSQRLQLLLRLLLANHGAEKGEELIRRTIVALDEAQRDRVLQALVEAKKPTPSAQVQIREPVE